MSAAEAEQVVGRCRVLRKYAYGLMAKLLHLHSSVLSTGGKARPQCLQSSDYSSKMRKKLDYSFPEVPDACRTPQFDHTAQQTLQQLQEVYECFDEVLELKDAMLSAIRDVSGCRSSMFTVFKLDLNPVLMANFMGLLTAYAKLHITLSRLDERKSALGLYFAAAAAARRRAGPSWKPLADLLLACDDPVRAVAAELGSPQECGALHDCVAAALQELSESVRLVLDPAQLRAVCALSALAGGESALPLPVTAPLSARQPSVSLHSELGHAAGHYLEWVVYAGLVLPQVVFGAAPSLELFGRVTRELLVVDLTRGHSVNVHQELDRLKEWFPSAKGGSVAPLGKIKFKDYIKDLRKAAEAHCESKQRQRRAYVAQELLTLQLVLEQCPGLLGPKWPVVLAALSLAKAEVLSYWRHLGQVGKRTHASAHAEDPDISQLIGASQAVTELVTLHSAVARRYYGEYLQGAHCTTLTKLIGALCSSSSGVTAKIGPGNVQRLLGLVRHLDGAAAAAEGSSDAASKLQEFRWDCDRLFGVLSDAPAKLLKLGEVDALLRRLNTVRAHSLLVDDLQGLLLRRTALTDAWWHLEALHRDFNVCIYGAEPVTGRYAVAYMRVLAASALGTPLRECPEEQAIVGSGCAAMCEEIAKEISARIVKHLQTLMTQALHLESKASAQEAFFRYERQHAAASNRRRGVTAAPVDEPMPGRESSGENPAALRDLQTAQLALASLLEAFATDSSSDTPGASGVGIAVHDRLIVVRERVRAAVALCFREQIRGLTKFEAGVDCPTVVLSKITVCAGVLQTALGSAQLDVDSIIRRALLDECTEWTRAANNTAHNANDSNPSRRGSSTADKRGFVLDSYGFYYIDLLKRMSPELGDLQGVVYVAERSGYVCLPKAASQKSGVGMPVDLFLDKAEFKALCVLLGAGGARKVEQAILDFIAARVRDVHVLLSTHTDALNEFKHAHYAANSSSSSSYSSSAAAPAWDEKLRRLAPLGRLVDLSIAIGNALTMRRLLREALAEVCATSMPGLQAVISSAAAQLSAAAADGGSGLSTTTDIDPFETLADHVGLALTSSDHSSDHALSLALAGSVLDAHLWAALPYAYAAAFAADHWKRCRYQGSLDAFEGGEHMLIPAITSLFGVLLGRDAPAALHTYVDCAARTVLRMKQSRKILYREWNFPGMLAYLDMFVGSNSSSSSSSSGVDSGAASVDRSVLEGIIPYSLIHAAYLELSRTGAA